MFNLSPDYFQVSSGRGNFLLNQADIPSSSNVRPSRSNVKTKKNSIQDKTVTSNLSPTRKKEVEKKPVQLLSVNESPMPDSTTIVSDSNSIKTSDFDNFLKPQNPVPYKNRHNVNIENEINEIVQWPINWLVEQSNTDISPPVCKEIQPRYIPNIFRSHEEYVQTMKPLIFLELWQFVYQSACHNEESRYSSLRISKN